MRRRNFIATLPLAAAGPALTQDRPPGPGRGWARVEARELTDLGSVATPFVSVSGSGRILGFGAAPDGVSRTLRFGGAVALVHDPARLFLPNNGEDLLTAAGDVLTVVSLGDGRWVATAYQPATVFAKVDRRPSQGGSPFRLSVGGDANTLFPDFAVDGSYERVKTVAKSIILGDPADTTEIGAIAATGTAAAPAPWTGYTPHHVSYSYAPHVPLDGRGAPAAATYNGRFAQEYFFQLETPGPHARGGGIAWGVTMPGQIVPYDRMWLRNYGLVLPGRAVFEDSGHRYGYQYGTLGPGGAQGNFHHIFAPGPVNWGDVAGWGNLSLIATDETQGCAVIAIRRNGALGQGHDWMYSLAADELRLHTVKDGVRTPRWGVPVEDGHLLPVFPRVTDIGSRERPLRRIHADRIEAQRAVFSSGSPDPSGEVVRLVAGVNAGFLRAVRGEGEAAFEVDGRGAVALGGGVTGSGAGVGEYMEWADGNPRGEDRVGWAVALEGGRIRRARPDDPERAVIGVVTARALAVGNAAWSHWSGKYLADHFGRPLTRPVEWLRWTEPVRETRQAERTRLVRERVVRPRREEVELIRERPSVELSGGRWVLASHSACTSATRPAVQTVALHKADGAPLTDACGAPVTAEAPVYEEAEIERTETCSEPVEVEVGQVERCCRADEVPAGTGVPPDAERFVAPEPILNPAFDPDRSYAPRAGRAEWDVVSFCGQERVRKGERTGERWVRLREVSPEVEEWLVR